MLDRFCAEHREMIALANQIVRMIDPANPPRMQELTRVRLDLASRSTAHLEAEIKFVKRVLGGSDDPIAQAACARYFKELVDIELSLAAHSGKWNPVMIRADWAGYRTAVRQQLAVAVERMGWEERVLFALAREARRPRAGVLEPL